MSVDYLHSSSPPPLKRLRDSTLSLPTILNTKCGEIFVNNNWDKWSFNCAFCQKTTSDIGVFVCHIRLEHLNEQQLHTTNELENCINNSITNDSSRTETNIFSNSEAHTLPNVPQQPTNNMLTNNPESFPSIVVNSGTICSKVSKIINLETLTDPVENSDKQQNDNFNKNSANIISNDFFAITSLGDHENEPEDKKEIIEVVYINDDDETDNKDKEFLINNDSRTNDADEVEPDNVSETESNYIPSSGEEYEEDEENTLSESPYNAGEVASTSNTNRSSNYVPKYPFKCQYCPRDFKSQRGAYYHESQVHDVTHSKNFQYKCQKCEKAFKTFQGLLAHKRFHDKDCHFKCPVCPVNNHIISHFLKHVMTHKSDTCHPCQVCGEVFSTDEERLKHWNTHAKELPYDCDVCSRRFRRMHILTHHKKCHGQYNCYFCPAIFNSKLTLHPPYVCPTCEKEPDIKQKVEFQRSLAEKRHVFESDEEF